jgi:hypothetical protein
MNNKIVCSLEDWDSIIDFHRPNGSSKTWYIKELGKLNIPLMWGDWNVYREGSKEIFGRETFVDLVTPYHLKSYIDFLPKSKIGNSCHIYLIPVWSPSFFYLNNSIGFSCMDEKYKTDVREGKSKIVIIHLFEGYSGSEGNYDFETIESWRNMENFPKDSVHYVSGNLISNEIVKQKNLKLNVFGVTMFETWNWDFCLINMDKPSVDFTPEDDRYLFLSYNRMTRGHRIFLMSEFINKNLLDRGLISLNKVHHVSDEFISEENAQYIIENTPFIIDSKYDLNYNLACNISKSDYEKTFISVVTETIVNDNTLFLSEKIWKPIIVGHPFLVYGNVGTLKYLKSLGYKTFDKWVDESYDNELDKNKRGTMVVDELNKFSSLTIDELKKIREEMFEICEYNKQHFLTLFYKDWEYNTSIKLKNYIQNIWTDLKEKNKNTNLI